MRVSAGVTLGKLHLVPHLPTFLAENPELSIDLVLDDRPLGLLEEGIDLAIRSGPLCDSALVARKIAATERVVLGTPEYFKRAGTPRTPADLARHEAVIYTLDRGGSDTWHFRKAGEEALATLPDRLRVSASEAVRAAVLRGMGLAVTPRWMFDPEFATGEVRPVLTDWSLPESDLWVLYSAGRPVNAKTRAFVRHVELILRAAFQPEMKDVKTSRPQHLAAVA